MIQKEFVIQNKVGLHARPAAIFVQTANRFKSKIVLERDGKTADAKSILNILSLAAEEGVHIIIQIDGEDEEIAMKELGELIENKFGEE